MSEGIVNNLLNHQGVRHASWKGLALPRFQVGLAILVLNTLKWHKIRHSQLRPMTLQPAACFERDEAIWPTPYVRNSISPGFLKS